MSRLDKPVGTYTAKHRDALYIYKTACKLLETPKAARKAITDTLDAVTLDRCREEARRLLELRAKESPS